MAFDSDDTRDVVIALALGGIAGATIVQSHHDEKRKSQAEKEDPEGTASICDLVWDILNNWEPDGGHKEDDFTDDLVEFLRDELSNERGADGRRIEVKKRTRTLHGIPDVVIDDRLVLELKVDPREGEKDRLVGQCCKYSQEFVTWAVVIDMSDERIENLIALLEAKSLHYIEVIPFNDVGEEEDRDDCDWDDDEEE